MAAMPSASEDGQVPASPEVEALRVEVKSLMEMNKRELDFQVVDKAAWVSRKFLAFVKVKIRKREASLESLAPK